MTGPARNILTDKPILQLFRYGMIGVAINLALYSFYLLITYLGTEPKISMTIAYILGVFLGFIGHRTWTFMHKGALLGSGARYIIAHISGYLINFLILLTSTNLVTRTNGYKLLQYSLSPGFCLLLTDILCSRKNLRGVVHMNEIISRVHR